MSTTIDQLATCLDALEVRYSRSAADRLEAGWTTDALDYHVLFVVREPLLTVVVPRVVTVPERRLDEIVQLANRLNASVIRWGAFWVDVEERRLTFQLGLPVLTPDALTTDLVELLLSATQAVPFFYPAFARVIWTGAAASTALSALLADQPDATDPDDEDSGLSEAV